MLPQKLEKQSVVDKSASSIISCVAVSEPEFKSKKSKAISVKFVAFIILLWQNAGFVKNRPHYTICAKIVIYAYLVK